jgi:hypothetical protein
VEVCLSVINIAIVNSQSKEPAGETIPKTFEQEAFYAFFENLFHNKARDIRDFCVLHYDE